MIRNDLNDPFGLDFFIYKDSFSHISALPDSKIKMQFSYSTDHCCLCNSLFNKSSPKSLCSHCGMLYCSNCTRDRGNKTLICSCCFVLIQNKKNFQSIQTLDSWRNIHVREAISPVQTSLHFFTHLMKSPEMTPHHFAVRILYKYCFVYFKEMEEAALYSELLFHSLNCKCASRAYTIDMFCNFAVKSPLALRSSTLTYTILEPLLRATPFSIAKAAMRLLFILSQNRLISVDDKIVIDLIRSKDTVVVTYAIAALTHHFKWPNFFSLSSLSFSQTGCDFSNVKLLTKNVLKLFESAEISASTQYYSAILLLKIAESKECISVFKKFSISSLTKTIIRNLPSSDGMTDHFSIVSIILTSVLVKLYKNIQINKISIKISDFFDPALNVISSVLIINKEYDSHSYLGFLQRNIVVLADLLIESGVNSSNPTKEFANFLNSSHYKPSLDKLREIIRNGSDSNDCNSAIVIEQQKKTINGLQKQLSLLENSVNEKVEDVRSEMKKVIEDEISCKTQVIKSQSAKEVLELTKETANLKETAENIVNQLKSKVELVESLKKEIEELKSNCKKGENEIEQIISELSNKEEEIRLLKEVISSGNSSKDSEIMKINTEKSNQIESLIKELKEIKEKKQISETENQKHTKEIEELNQKMEIFEKQKEQLKETKELSDIVQTQKLEIAQLRHNKEQRELEHNETLKEKLEIILELKKEIENIKSNEKENLILIENLKMTRTKFVNAIDKWNNEADKLCQDHDLDVNVLVPMPNFV